MEMGPYLTRSILGIVMSLWTAGSNSFESLIAAFYDQELPASVGYSWLFRVVLLELLSSVLRVLGEIFRLPNL